MSNIKHIFIIICVSLLLLSGCSDTPHTEYTVQNRPETSTITTATTAFLTSAATETTTSSTTHTTLTTVTTQTESSVTATTTTTTKTTRTQSSIQGSHHIDAPILAQRPDYPSGCESVSAVMLLQYWGEDVTIDEFIDNHLPRNADYYYQNGRYCGPSPYEYFIGNPRTEQAYGCMAPAIQKAINHYYDDDSFTQNATGLTLPELCETYIANDQPVLVWVTIGMVETYPGDQWYLEDGTLFTWPINEHCMLLVGYDANYYYFNDPYTGKLKKYAHWICEDRYAALGQQAIAIVK